MVIPEIPLEPFLNSVIDTITVDGQPIFDLISAVLTGATNAIKSVLMMPNPVVLALAAAAFVWWKRGIRHGLTTFMCLALISNLGLWAQAVDTVALTAVATLLSVLIGIPMGIVCAERPGARSIIVPIMDSMQSTPSFVYLAPAVAFFSVGVVPGILVTVMFALPPAVRSTELGLSQVDPTVIEAAEAFGSTRGQTLLTVKLPLAASYVFLALNQSIMMSLNVVVIASLIGAPGLGVEIVTSLAQLDLPKGIEAGTAIVLLALALDQLTAMPTVKRGRRRFRAFKLSPKVETSVNV